MAESRGPLGWPLILALSATIGILQLTSVLNPALVERDPEEMYNAGHAWLLLHGHLSALWRLQYRDFCGGCTLDAGLGSLLFAFLPRSWLVWKLVPIGFTVALAATGLRILSAAGERRAAAAWALLLLLPPAAALHLSLIAWGNHFEAGTLGALAALVLLQPLNRRRAALGGLLAGLATWVSFSGVSALVAALSLPFILRQQRFFLPVLGGVMLGILPWLGQGITAHTHPFVTIYEPGESLPSLARIPHKLATLVKPGQLVALFGLPNGPTGWLLGWGAGGSTLLALLIGLRSPMARVPMVFLGAWLGVYLVVRFQVYDPPWPEIAGPGSVRYAAPIYPLLALLVALLFGALPQPLLRFFLAGPLLLSGIAARVVAQSPPFPSPALALFDPIDLDGLRLQLSYLLSDEEHSSCSSNDGPSRALHAYALGRNEVTRLLLADPGAALHGLTIRAPEVAWSEGVGEALIEQLDHNESGGIAALEAVDLRLTTLPETKSTGLRTALRAAASRRAHSPSDWTTLLEDHDGPALGALSRLLEGRSPAIRDAVGWAAGRRFAADITAFAQPRPLSLPPVPPTLGPSFWEGLGYGLGEEWGPTAAPDAMMELPSIEAQPAFTKGWAAGQARRWLPAGP